LIEILQQSARTALAYAEAASVTRHGHGGLEKQRAEAAVASCYTHFASRALDPQLHVHAFMFNLGKRKDVDEWSAVEQRTMFDRKMAIGIMFRVELASRLRGLGFDIVPAGPYFAIRGIDESQRAALSTRSRQIAEYMQTNGMEGGDATAAREIAALNSRASKSEPPLSELLDSFEKMAASLGIDPARVLAMRSGPPRVEEAFAIDHAALLAELTEAQSCATAQEALAMICEKAMGRWSAAECLDELERFMRFEQVVQLGMTEQLTQVFTSKATMGLEAAIDRCVRDGASDASHRVAARLVDREFDQLETELRARLGVPVSLGQQRDAALHIAQSGRHAFVEGWAGTGKTTMLKSMAAAYGAGGFQVLGCCQSAAAAQNLARETGMPCRTIASLLLSLRDGRTNLKPKSILVLDEAGMVGSADIALLQEQVLKAGGKFVCVGDPKQLQPIGAGGIFGSLMREHGRAEISNIQRQRTDFAPLLDWLDARSARRDGGLTPEKARALRLVPEDARMAAMEAVCSKDAKLSRAFGKWRARFDHEWMREVVEQFAKGDALPALESLDARGRLELISGLDKTMAALISAWETDKTPLAAKAMVAGTRAEVSELNRLARERLAEAGTIKDLLGAEIEIVHRDETREAKRFAPGDRVVFTMNDRQLGVVNGAAGTVRSIASQGFEPRLVVELDDPNEREERLVSVPASFGRFDLAYCLTNHKAQGRTFDSAYVLANPAMSDREWTYVAASRSRFATTMFVNTAALGLVDPESHRPEGLKPKSRDAAIKALAGRMRRSRAKGTSLDYENAPASQKQPEQALPARGAAWTMAVAFIDNLRAKSRARHQQLNR
jgi:hypothetical protein